MKIPFIFMLLVGIGVLIYLSSPMEVYNMYNIPEVHQSADGCLVTIGATCHIEDPRNTPVCDIGNVLIWENHGIEFNSGDYDCFIGSCSLVLSGNQIPVTCDGNYRMTNFNYDGFYGNMDYSGPGKATWNCILDDPMCADTYPSLYGEDKPPSEGVSLGTGMNAWETFLYKIRSFFDTIFDSLREVIPF